MGKLTVIGLIWLLLFAVTLILIDDRLSVDKSGKTSNGTQEPQDTGSYQTSGFMALQVNGSLVDAFWDRGINDLPVRMVTVNYTVENVGNASANTVTIEIALNSAYYSTETVHNLLPSSGFTDSISFSVEYDQSKTVEIEATSENVTAYWSYVVDAKLPRQPSWSVAKLFITPEEQYVQSAYKEIIDHMFFTSPYVDWIVIRNWVDNNIKYVNDNDSHGVTKFWQLGKETLQSRTGDCEDFAILLCSLLRADGWSVDDVYVVVGQNDAGDYHAWVKIKIPMVGWYNIDPQRDGWSTLVGDFVALNGYTAIYNFNDEYFVVL
jgi:hypothetical protein